MISPHGSGIEPAANARRWGNLPALGRFAVVNPEGQGAHLELYSWGSPGEIADLARMPRIVHEALPWLRIDKRRIYAIGASMGGQETLLLAAEHPRLLAGAVSFDAPTNMAARYAAFPLLRGGRALQELARLEFGGIPRLDHEAWADRSPLFYARELAFSRLPLEIWWSTRDRIVVHQRDQSGLLYRAIERLNPHAPVTQFVGTWHHAAEMRPLRRLPSRCSGSGCSALRRGERQHVVERCVLEAVCLGDRPYVSLPSSVLTPRASAGSRGRLQRAHGRRSSRRTEGSHSSEPSSR